MIAVVLLFVFAIFVLAVILSLLLRRKLREKYAILWLLVGFAMLVLAVIPPLLGWFADLLGVAVPSNLVFALAMGLLILVAVHLSWELSTAEDEVRRLAEEVAILRNAIERIEDSVVGLRTGDARPSTGEAALDDPARLDGTAREGSSAREGQGEHGAS